MAPMDDPQITLLVIVDSPRGAQYGSVVAAPCAKKILKNVLRYMAISPTSEEASGVDSEESVKVPKVTGKTFKEAKEILHEAGLKISRPESTKNKDNWKVVDQYPKEGTEVKKNSTVYVYKE